MNAKPLQASPCLVAVAALWVATPVLADSVGPAPAEILAMDSVRVHEAVVPSVEETAAGGEERALLTLAPMAVRFQPESSEQPTGAGEGQPPAHPPEHEGGGDTELAKKLSNPIADLISIPFQLNYDEGFGPKDAERWLLNIQPVIPVSISEDWNVIIRTIVPVVYLGSIAESVSDRAGLGDTTQSFFFSPKAPIGGWILGAGPVFNWPTATENDLGTRKWSAGPTVVALRQEHGWTYGALLNHEWSYAGESDRDTVNQSFLQPFITYTFPTATTLILNTESTYDWNDSQWTVPINGMVAQIFRIGKLPIQLQIGGRYYADKPPDGPEWGLRFTFTILLPK